MWPGRSDGQRGRKQPVVLRLHHRVTLATALLQPSPVEHLDTAACIVNQPCPLKAERGLGDPFAANPEHVGDEFLRHDQIVAVKPVQAQQQPAAELLVQRMMPVAHGSLRHLRDKRLRVAQQQMQHRPGAIEFSLHARSAQPISLACTLHHRTVGGGLATHEERDADKPFPTNHCNFGGGAVFQHVQQGDDGGRRKVNVALQAARLVEHLPQFKLHPFKLRLPAQPFRIGKRGQQLIELRVVCDWAHVILREVRH